MNAEKIEKDFNLLIASIEYRIREVKDKYPHLSYLDKFYINELINLCVETRRHNPKELSGEVMNTRNLCDKFTILATTFDLSDEDEQDRMEVIHYGLLDIDMRTVK